VLLCTICFQIKLIKLRASVAWNIPASSSGTERALTRAKTCAHINNYHRQGNILRAQLLGELVQLGWDKTLDTHGAYGIWALPISHKFSTHPRKRLRSALECTEDTACRFFREMHTTRWGAPCLNEILVIKLPLVEISHQNLQQHERQRPSASASKRRLEDPFMWKCQFSFHLHDGGSMKGLIRYVFWFMQVGERRPRILQRLAINQRPRLSKTLQWPIF
jgi:hypothetical protein